MSVASLPEGVGENVAMDVFSAATGQELTFALPEGITSGDYRLGVVADPDLRVGDADRTDNAAFAGPEVQVRNPTETGPDLEWVDRNGLACRAEMTCAGAAAIHQFDGRGFDVWGYDRDGRYAPAYDRAPLQASPFPVRDDTVPAVQPASHRW